MKNEARKLQPLAGEKERILELIERVSEGQLEARRTLVPPSEPLAKISVGLNHLLDKVESFMRESMIAMNELANGTKPRGIDQRGYKGTFDDSAKLFNAQLNESYARKKQVHDILDNLGQAFMTCDRTGKLGADYSKATETLFDFNPRGATLSELLQLDSSAAAQTDEWLNLVFEEAIEFESLVNIGPKSFEHPDGRFVELTYKPIRDEDNRITNLIVIGTDKTFERQLQRAAEKEAAFVRTVVAVSRDRETFVDFVDETRQFFEWLKTQTPSQFDLANCFRLVHSLKGGAAAYALIDIQKKAHACEDRLAEMKSASRLDPERLSHIVKDLESVGENFEVFLKSNEAVLGSFGESDDHQVRTLPLAQILKINQKLSRDLGADSPSFQYVRDELLFENAAGFFSSFEKVVLNTAEKVDKLVEFEVLPTDVRLFKVPYKPLLASLVHAFRNAVDHGIETPDVRVDARKSEFGRVEVLIRACESNRVRISICDDGAGMNVERVRTLAVQRGLLKQEIAATLSEEQVCQFVLEPGFSTKDQVNELSGRGVGLDAIRFEARKLGGDVHVESVSGKGSCLVIEVPIVSTDF